MSPDHYQVLGVQPGAGPREIRAAYLRLMRAWHPDVRPGEEAAAETARQANAAWAVLGDHGRRNAYDRLRGPRQPATPAAAVVAGGPAGPPAYGAHGHHYRRAFSRACLRVGGAMFAGGLLLLAVAG